MPGISAVCYLGHLGLRSEHIELDFSESVAGAMMKPVVSRNIYLFTFATCTTFYGTVQGKHSVQYDLPCAVGLDAK